MSLLNKLTIKNLNLNRKRTIVTIIGIILSVALIAAVSSLYSSAVASLISFEVKEKGNYHFALYNVDRSYLEKLNNNRSIDNYYITENIGYAKIASKNPSKPYAFIKSFNNESLKELSISLTTGRMPQNDSEIVIPTHLRTNGRVEYQVGDEITLEIGDRVYGSDQLTQINPYVECQNDECKYQEDIINTTKKTYKIVGIINRPSNSVESYSAPGYTFITYNSDNVQSNVDVYINLNKKGLNNYETVLIGLLKDHEYEYKLNSYLISLQTNPLTDENISGLGTVVVIVCIIIIITSVFCIKNSFDISITEKIKQYGMLISIGATKKQIKKNVFYEATILGAIGIPLGIIGGILASYILIIISNLLLKEILTENLLLVFKFSFIPIIIAIILGIVTIYLSALRSANKASRISPIASIRNSANIKIKKLNCPKIISKLFGIGGEISYKNLKRNKRKYRTTVISIIVSVSIFIALSYFMSMAFQSIKSEVNYKEYNLVLRTSANKDDPLYIKSLDTVNFPNINDYTIHRSDLIYIEKPQYDKDYPDVLHEDEEIIYIVALGDHEYQKYIRKLNLNYEDVKDKGILIDDVYYSLYNEDETQTIEYHTRKLAYLKNEIINGITNKNKSLNIEIAKITDLRPFGFSDSVYQSMLVISDEYFDNNFETEGLIIYYDAKNPTVTQDKIEEYLKDEDDDIYINNYEENYNIMKNLFTLVGIFLYGFIIVIILIGITNIFNTITTNMELRRNEFAMLKSIGMTTKEFKRMIRLESIFMGLKSLFIGIPIGLILSYIIFNALKTRGEVFKIPYLSILITIIAVYLLITLIMHYSLKKINKQNTIETIRNENI